MVRKTTMSEDSIKRQKRRLVSAVTRHFQLTVDEVFRLDGRIFDLEFCDGFQTWKIRCVPGSVSSADKDLVKRTKLNPAYFRKAIAYRPQNGRAEFELLKIE